ncbi:MAG TPA: hypothetical protein VFU15_00475 [Bacteroidia bacterium]|nr:hypothetical protein [Bacteroidia bacterium]
MNFPKSFFLPIILFFFACNAFGQDILYLQKKDHPHRFRKLPLDREYRLKTKDSLYFSDIFSVTDSTLSVIAPVFRSDSETVYDMNGKPSGKKAITRLAGNDTVIIPFSRIQYIRKDFVKNNQWVVPFIYGGFGAAAGILFLPFALIDGPDTFHNWILFEGVLVGVCGPALLIGVGSRKFDTQEKWELKRTK